jgi:hypothetical protein
MLLQRRDATSTCSFSRIALYMQLEGNSHRCASTSEHVSHSRDTIFFEQNSRDTILVRTDMWVIRQS